MFLKFFRRQIHFKYYCHSLATLTPLMCTYFVFLCIYFYIIHCIFLIWICYPTGWSELQHCLSNMWFSILFTIWELNFNSVIVMRGKIYSSCFEVELVTPKLANHVEMKIYSMWGAGYNKERGLWPSGMGRSVLY